MNAPSISPYQSLENKLYKTKASRFNADERLRVENYLANYTLMFLSVYNIALSAGPAFNVEIFKGISEFWALILSIALLGIAALEVGNERAKKALKLHENAIKVNKLHRELIILGTQATTDELKQINTSYSAIEAECEYNHSEIDILLVNIWNTNLDCKIRILSALLWLIHYTIRNAVYWAAIILPPLLLWKTYL